MGLSHEIPFIQLLTHQMLPSHSSDASQTRASSTVRSGPVGRVYRLQGLLGEARDPGWRLQGEGTERGHRSARVRRMPRFPHAQLVFHYYWRPGRGSPPGQRHSLLRPAETPPRGPKPYVFHYFGEREGSLSARPETLPGEPPSATTIDISKEIWASVWAQFKLWLRPERQNRKVTCT